MHSAIQCDSAITKMSEINTVIQAQKPNLKHEWDWYGINIKIICCTHKYSDTRVHSNLVSRLSSHLLTWRKRRAMVAKFGTSKTVHQLMTTNRATEWRKQVQITTQCKWSLHQGRRRDITTNLIFKDNPYLISVSHTAILATTLFVQKLVVHYNNNYTVYPKWTQENCHSVCSYCKH